MTTVVSGWSWALLFVQYRCMEVTADYWQLGLNLWKSDRPENTVKWNANLWLLLCESELVGLPTQGIRSLPTCGVGWTFCAQVSEKWISVCQDDQVDFHDMPCLSRSSRISTENVSYHPLRLWNVIALTSVYKRNRFLAIHSLCQRLNLT